MLEGKNANESSLEGTGSKALYFDTFLLVNSEVEMVEHRMLLVESTYLSYNHNRDDELYERCNGHISIKELDSAYAIGKNEYYKWEIEFISITITLPPLEVMGEELEGEQTDEYIIADQSKVARVFSGIINSTHGLDITDRERMEGLIQCQLRYL